MSFAFASFFPRLSLLCINRCLFSVDRAHPLLSPAIHRCWRWVVACLIALTACAVSHGQDEAIIEENGHLPGMPSVTTVAEEGVSIGEVQRVLLKNVEELTLRLIEKDKRVKELEERNSSLEDRLERIERMLMEERE